MAGESRDYLMWVKRQKCLAEASGDCEGVVNAHHAGDRGLGQKAHDDTAIPLCAGHHHAWHSGGPPFSGSTKVLRRMWRNLAIATIRARWAAIHAPRQSEGIPF